MTPPCALPVQRPPSVTWMLNPPGCPAGAVKWTPSASCVKGTGITDVPDARATDVMVVNGGLMGRKMGCGAKAKTVCGTGANASGGPGTRVTETASTEVAGGSDWLVTETA